MIFLLLFFQYAVFGTDSCGVVFSSPQKRLEQAFPGVPAAQLQKMFSRDGSEVKNVHYLSNMVDVATSFQAWLLNPDRQEFSENLSHWHRLAQTGRDGKTYYWPEAEHLYQAKPTAGLYRSDQTTLDQPLLHDGRPSVRSAEIIERLTQNQNVEIVRYSGIPRREKIPLIIGLPQAAWPRYFLNGKGFPVTYAYPSPRHISAYVKQMDQSMQIIVNNWRNPERREVILKALARYYHLGVIGHPFQRVNNSLLMTQVNVILLQVGMRPVAHGEHDYVMRALDSDAATKYFLEVVMAENAL